MFHKKIWNAMNLKGLLSEENHLCKKKAIWSQPLISPWKGCC